MLPAAMASLQYSRSYNGESRLELTNASLTDEERDMLLSSFGRRNMKRIVTIQRYWRTWGIMLRRFRLHRSELLLADQRDVTRQLIRAETFDRNALVRQHRRDLLAVQRTMLEAEEIISGETLSSLCVQYVHFHERENRANLEVDSYLPFGLIGEAMCREALYDAEQVAFIGATSAEKEDKQRLALLSAARPRRLMADPSSIVTRRSAEQPLGNSGGTQRATKTVAPSPPLSGRPGSSPRQKLRARGTTEDEPPGTSASAAAPHDRIPAVATPRYMLGLLTRFDNAFYIEQGAAGVMQPSNSIEASR